MTPQAPPLVDRHSGLYSASARMLCAQGGPAWHGEHWPDERTRAWRELEAALLAAPPASGMDPGSDPARTLASRRAGAASVPVEDAVRVWRARLDADPGPPAAGAPAAHGNGAVIVDAAWRTELLALLDELDQRLAPGRPACVIAPEAASLSTVIAGAAAALSAPLAETSAESAASAESTAAAAGVAAPDSARRTAARGGAPAEDAYLRLRDAAKRAALAVPSREDARRAGDFSVRITVCDAAADLLHLLAGGGAPAWRERHDGIDPRRHLVSDYRWDEGGGHPVPFAERAGELRAVFTRVPAPRLGPPDDPVLESPDPSGSQAVFSATAALVAAEVLEELAARLAPGVRTGPVPFTAYPLHLFLEGRLRRVLTAG